VNVREGGAATEVVGYKARAEAALSGEIAPIAIRSSMNCESDGCEYDETKFVPLADTGLFVVTANLPPVEPPLLLLALLPPLPEDA
jgi:hypothetical protein